MSISSRNNMQQKGEKRVLTPQKKLEKRSSCNDVIRGGGVGRETRSWRQEGVFFSFIFVVVVIFVYYCYQRFFFLFFFLFRRYDIIQKVITDFFFAFFPSLYNDLTLRTKRLDKRTRRTDKKNLSLLQRSQIQYKRGWRFSYLSFLFFFFIFAVGVSFQRFVSIKKRRGDFFYLSMSMLVR